MKLTPFLLAASLALSAFSAQAARIELGDGATAQYYDDIAIGNGAYAGHDIPGCTPDTCGTISAIAIGRGARAIDGIAIGDNASATTGDGIAIGVSTVADNFSVAVGGGAVATGWRSVSMGLNSMCTGEQSVCLGHNAQSAHTNSVALGAGTFTDDDNQVAVGNRQISQVAAGTEDQDAVNLGQIAPMATALGGGASFANGVFTPPSYVFISGASYSNVGDALADLDGRVYALEQNQPGPGPQGPAGPQGPQGPAGPQGPQGPAGQDGADGAGGTGEPGPQGPEGPQGPAGQDGTDGEDGEQGPEGPQGPAGQDGTDGTDGRDGVDGEDGEDGRDGERGPQGPEGPQGPAGEDGRDGVADCNMAVCYDDETRARVSLGGTDAPAPVQLRNVADGRIERGSTDAVNGGQIWAIEQNWNDRWTEVNNRIDGLEGHIDAVGAQGAAMAMMAGASSYLPVGKIAISAGYGQYGSKAAFAVGAKIRFNERTSGSFGLSATPSGGGKLMIGVGVSYVLP